jgi:D-lactate dehydrogenase
MPDIFFYEAFEEEADAIRRYLPESIEAGFSWKTIQECGHSAPAAPVISIRTQSIIPEAWAGDLRGIMTRSTGHDHILAYRRATGVDVPAGYLPLYCNRAVAEQAMLLWMALLRKLPVQMSQFATFHRDGLTGYECAGKRLLVVGVGNIGSEVVRIGQGLAMEVRGVDLEQKHDFVEYTTLEQGLGWADIVVCAMSLNEGNCGIFGRENLLAMKQGAFFVNIARGELSPSTELLAALEVGHLRGVGLDVYNHESELAVALREGRASTDAEVAATLALSSRPDVILTPHNAFNTAESVDRKAAQSIEQLQHLMATGEFLWPVV